MIIAKPDRPYFDTWLRRTGRQFAVSGRLTQVAMVLASENGETLDAWSARLRMLLEGQEVPSLDLLMRIDALLAGAKSARKKEENPAQGQLFDMLA